METSRDDGTPEDTVSRVLELTATNDTLLTGLGLLLKALKQKAVREDVLNAYLHRSRDCKELLAYFQWERSKQTDEAQALCLLLLESVLLFTASAAGGSGRVRSAGVQLVQALLQNHMRSFYTCLASGGKTTALALRLLTAMVTQSAGCAHDVFALFDFSYTYLDAVAQHRPGSHRAGSLRRCFVNFALSFLVVGGPDVVQGVLAAKRFLLLVLNSSQQDPHDMAVMVLGVLREKVVQNELISKKSKSSFFTSSVLSDIAKLIVLADTAGNAQNEGAEPEANDIDLPLCSYNLLLDLCTSSKLGISYKSKWDQFAAEKTNNPALLGLLLSLSNHVHQKLVALLTVKTLSSCPDALLPYLKSFPLSFEPRPAKKFFIAVEFILKVYAALPDFQSIWLALKSHDFEPTHLSSVLGYCMPPPVTRRFLNSGLQSSSLLVKHHTLLLVNMGLARAAAVLSSGGPEGEGARLGEELLDLLPDVKTFITLHRNLCSGRESSAPDESNEQLSVELVEKSKELLSSGVLLAQVLDAMSTLQILYPVIFLEAGFDASKLIVVAEDNKPRPPDKVVVQTLKFLSSLPKGALKWYQQGSKTLETIAGFVSSDEPVLVGPSLQLLRSILLEIPLLGKRGDEVTLFLHVLWSHCATHLSGENGRSAMLDLFAAVFVRMMKDSNFRSTIASEVKTELGMIPCAFIVYLSTTLQKQQQQQQASCLLFLGELVQTFVLFSSEPRHLARLFLSKLDTADLLNSYLSSPQTRTYFAALWRFLMVVGGDFGVSDAPGSCAASTTSTSTTSTTSTTTSTSTTSTTRLDKSAAASQESSSRVLHCCTEAHRDGLDSLPPLKKRLKTLLKAGASPLPVQSFLSEVLCTGMDEYSRELPGTMKWAKRDLPPAAFSRVSHLVSFLPLKLTFSLDDMEHVPPSAILNSLVLNTVQDSPPTSTPKCKKKKDLLRVSSGLSLSGLVTEHKDSLEALRLDVLTNAHGPEHLLHCAGLVKLSCLSLFAMVNSNVEWESEHNVSESISFLMSFLKDLLQAISSEVQKDGLFDVTTILIKSLLTSPVFITAFLTRPPTTISTTNLAQLGKRAHSERNSGCQEKMKFTEEAAIFVHSVAKFSQQWAVNPFVTDLLSKVADRATSCMDGCSLAMLTVLFPLLCEEEKAGVFSSSVLQCLQFAKEKSRWKMVNGICKFLQSCLTIPSEGQTLDELTSVQEFCQKGKTDNQESSSLAKEPISLSVLSEHDCDKPASSKNFFMISVDLVERLMSLLTGCHQKGKPLPHLCSLESVLLSVLKLQALPPPTRSGAAEESGGLAAEITEAVRSVRDHWSQFNRTTGLPLTGLLGEGQLELLCTQGQQPVVDVGSLDVAIFEPYLSSVLHHPTPVSVRVCELVVDGWARSSSSSAGLGRVGSAVEEWLAQCSPTPDQVRPLLPVFKARLRHFQAGCGGEERSVTADSVLWDCCTETILAGDPSDDVAAVVLDLLIASSPSEDCRKRGKRVLKNLLQRCGQASETGCWTGSQLSLLQWLLPGLSGTPHSSSLLSSAVLTLLGSVHHRLSQPQPQPGQACGTVGEDRLIAAATRCLNVCRNCDKIVGKVLTGSEFSYFPVIVRQILKKHFTSVLHMTFLCELVGMVYGSHHDNTLGDVLPGDMIVKMIWSHSQFLSVMLCNLEQEHPHPLQEVKSCMVRLLVHLVGTCEECTRSHVPLLLAAYSGTLARTDRGILHLLTSYEARGVRMGEFRPFMFGRPALEHFQSKQGAGWLVWREPSFTAVLDSLDRGKLFASVCRYPLSKPLEPINPFENVNFENGNDCRDDESEDIYDPSFLLPFFAHHLQTGLVVDCQRFVEVGCWGYLAAALSSRCKDVRTAACHCLSLFGSHLEGTRFRDKTQVVLLMEVLSNSLLINSPKSVEEPLEGESKSLQQEDDEEEDVLPGETCSNSKYQDQGEDPDAMDTAALGSTPQPLLSVHAQLFMRLSLLLLRPDNDLYPVLCDLLVYRPNLDLSLIPFANILLYSTSAQATLERTWALRWLVDGLRTEEDYRLYKKQKLVPSALTFWISDLYEPETKSLILQLLQRLIRLPQALRDLVKRQGLLRWLHTAVQHTRDRHKQRELLLLSCEVWRCWVTMVTGSAQDKGYIPYPHPAYDMAMILSSVTVETFKQDH